MSQHDLDIANQSFPAFRADLNDALEAIATLQSGGTAPATTYGGMPWIDTTDSMLKFRNVANDGWIDVMKLDLVNDVVKQVGQTIAPNGSVSQPSYTFDSDGDTGIYRKGTNSMGFGAGGTERMVVKSAGVDLLGTVTAPTQSSSDDSTKVATTAFVQVIREMLHPVGSVYINASDSTNPSTLLGFGTWVAFGEGRVLVGIDDSDNDFDTAEETGGAKTHTLTIDEMPSHSHEYVEWHSRNSYDGGSYTPTAYRTSDTSETGGDQPHNNLQPYIVVYMWKRTA